MVKIDISYLSDLQCKAVHGPSGTEIMTDAPVDNQGKGEYFSPTDLFATSLGTCFITIMGIAAKNYDIKLDGAKVHVEKHMSTDLPRRVSKIVVKIDLPPGIPHNKRQAIENASRNCPVSKSIHPDLKVDLSYNYPD
jgi:putative redox protein